MWFRKQKRIKGGRGDCIGGNVLITNSVMSDIGRHKLRKRLGARLFELADEHLTQRHSSLLRKWIDGASQKQLNWWYRGLLRYGGDIPNILDDICHKVRRLSDDDLEAQMLMAALGWRYE